MEDLASRELVHDRHASAFPFEVSQEFVAGAMARLSCTPTGLSGRLIHGSVVAHLVGAFRVRPHEH
jgi:hypothetical protein